MPIDPKRVQAVFLAAVEQADRATILDRECGDEPELRRRVDTLLKANDEPASYLDQPPVELAKSARTIDYAPVTEKPVSMVGPYKLKEQIGEGGFGLVFVAEQQQPVKHKVALKVIKPGMDTREVMARFTAERQALALMDHPNIARVLDAGATDSGWPYFVMELVRGIPITNYCDQNQLPPRDRLGLFVTVCQAVQHAASKRRHPPRHQAVECAGYVARRQAGGQGHRLRRGQGDSPATDRSVDLHAIPADDRHAALREPGTG